MELLLSAYEVAERIVILSKLERSDLLELTGLNTPDGLHKLIDRVANDNSLCGQIEISIHR